MRQTLDTICRNMALRGPFAVVRRIGVELGIAEVPVCNLGHSSSHEVVKVERDGTIGYCFVSVGKEKVR
jgi:hypothetical protein